MTEKRRVGRVQVSVSVPIVVMEALSPEIEESGETTSGYFLTAAMDRAVRDREARIAAQESAPQDGGA